MDTFSCAYSNGLIVYVQVREFEQATQALRRVIAPLSAIRLSPVILV